MPELPWGSRTFVMGVLNVTPDSFSDGGLHTSVEGAVAHALEMVRNGADIVDVGGESTAPGRQPVGEAEELRRVIPVVEALANALPGHVPVSIDTYKAGVARRAVSAGATIVNDVSGLRRDERMAATLAELDVSVVCGHMGEPRGGEDAAEFVAGELEAGLARAEACGLPRERIWIDPGFGFGKGVWTNLALTRSLGVLRRLGRPIVYGASRKRTVGVVSGVDAAERDIPSLAFVGMAAAQGADVIRVHNVAATVLYLKAFDAVARGHPAPYADTIHLAGMEFRATHGAYPEEHSRSQPFIVDATLVGDWRAAALPDRLERAVDYTAVRREAERVVDEVMAGPHRDLLETLADRIARRLLARFAISHAWVTVHKPEAPFSGPVHDVAVTTVRSRADLAATPSDPSMPDPAVAGPSLPGGAKNDG